MVEPWLARLAEGDADTAWDLLIGGYRRLIMATIRHVARDPDDLMDVFARVCETLHRDDLALLRRYAQQAHTALFSTWLVSVVRNQAIEWLRESRGRPRNRTPSGLSPLQQEIHRYVFMDGHHHSEAYELIRTRHAPDLAYGKFLKELALAYRLTPPAPRRRSVMEDAVPLPPDLPDATATPPDAHSDSRARLEAALGQLDGDVRLAVRLFVIYDMPASAVARVVGWADAKAVYNAVYRGLAAVRASLAREGIRGSTDL